MEHTEGRAALWAFLELWLPGKRRAIFPVPKVSSVKKVAG